VYGLIPMYGILAQPVDDAAYFARQQVRHHIPEEVEYDILDTHVSGDPIIDTNLSVEVEVVFPDVDTKGELPHRDNLFPTAEGVSVLAVEHADTEE